MITQDTKYYTEHFNPGNRKQKWAKKYSKIISENFKNLPKDMNLQIQKVKQTPNRINPGNLI